MVVAEKVDFVKLESYRINLQKEKVPKILQMIHLQAQKPIIHREIEAREKKIKEEVKETDETNLKQIIQQDLKEKNSSTTMAKLKLKSKLVQLN